MTAFKPTPHPVLRLPTAAEAMALGAEGLQRALLERETCIAKSRHDPLQFGYEPPVWKLCDALLGLPWVPEETVARVRGHFAAKLGADGGKLLEALRFLLILGSNRGSKTQYEVRTAVKLACARPGANIWMFHETDTMSIQYHHAGVYHYLPPAMRAKTQRSETTYAAYKQMTGFGGGGVIFPPAKKGEAGSQITFRNYQQDESTLQGGNLDLVVADELVPLEWLEHFKSRVATLDGWVIIGFTPIRGYTATVKRVCDGAVDLLEAPAYLVPKDGGDKDVAAALGLTPAELADVERAALGKKPPTSPESRPEPFTEIFGGVSDLPPAPSGREFATVPRVQKGAVKEEAIVYFHTRDNPFGNPKNIIAKHVHKGDDMVKELLYGVGRKLVATAFPKFDAQKVHVCAPGDVPKAGTNYRILDPCHGRNWFLLWFRVTPQGVWVYREFPGPYYLEGIGVPGPWTMPDGRKLDGRKGPAQDPFGWGFLRYKKLIAELEGWHDVRKPKPEMMPENEWIAEWDERNGADESIYEALADARYAQTKFQKDTGTSTLLEDLLDINLPFEPAAADDTQDGLDDINDALDFDEQRPVDYFNQPKLRISSACPNTIFALQTWTGADGQKGASRDPIDVLRYFFRGQLEYHGDNARGGGAPVCRGGGHY